VAGWGGEETGKSVVRGVVLVVLRLTVSFSCKRFCSNCVFEVKLNSFEIELIEFAIFCCPTGIV